MPDPSLDARISAVRRFNRFYTRRIGVLGEGHLGSPHSLTEVRVLYELARGTGPLTASRIGEGLGLDPGHLSRLLTRLGRQGLVARRRSEADSRQWELTLTLRGRARLDSLDRRAQAEIERLLAPLPEPAQAQVVESLTTAATLLGDDRAAQPGVVLRPHRPGDLGWIVQRHGELYAREYGWDERFEGLVSGIAADFLEQHDPRRERCWIAERNGLRVGSVLLVRHTERIAKLRLLLVEPSARGLGLGGQLVRECTRFARAAGYRKITLWTNSVLTAARRLYQAEGYQRVKSEKHHSFGHALVSETWELDLRG